MGDALRPGLPDGRRHRRVERVKLPGYVTATARVGANINEGVTVSLLGTNLFNAKYEEVPRLPRRPPLSLFSEIKLRY